MAKLYQPQQRNLATAYIKTDETHRWDGSELGKTVPRKYVMTAFGETLATGIPPKGVPYNAARDLRIEHGGGETNGAEAFAYCLDQPSAVFGALVRDMWGFAALGGLKEAGVDVSHILQFEADSLGNIHSPFYISEIGAGVRASRTQYFREHTPMRKVVKSSDFDWEKFHRNEGTIIAATGGICNLLSEETHKAVLAYLDVAGQYGCFRYTDLNFREALVGKGNDAVKEAQRRNQEMVRRVEMVIGNQSDFTKALGEEKVKVDPKAPLHEAIGAYQEQLKRVAEKYSNLKLVSIQLRNAITSDRIGWGALLYDVVNDKMYFSPILQGAVGEGVDIEYRVGGGDSVASLTAGILYLGKRLSDIKDLKLAKPVDEERARIFEKIGQNLDDVLQSAVVFGMMHGMLVQTIETDVSRILFSDLETHVKSELAGSGAHTLR